MSHHNEEIKINFTGTAILSFVIVFACLLLMSTCHGPFNVPSQKAATETPAEK